MATIAYSKDRAELQRRVRHPLQALRGYIRQYVTLEGLGVALLYVALWFWIGLVLDFGSYWLFGFDWVKELAKIAQGQSTDLVLRGILLGVLVAGLIAVVLWKIVLRLTREFSDPALALVLERRYPRELGDRLITAVELADPRLAGKYGYSQDLVDVTVNDAADRVERLPVRSVFNWARLGRLAVLVVGVPLGFYVLMAAGYFLWAALSERSATPSSFMHRFNGITATWLERNILLHNTEWPPTGYLEVVRFQDTPEHPGEMRLGLEAQRPDIQVRAVQWIIFDAEEEAWRPARWRDLPDLLGDQAPRVDLPAHWPGWVIDVDDLDARVPKDLLPEDAAGKTSGHIRRALVERQRFLERAGVLRHVEDLLNWQTWTMDQIAIQINDRGDVRRALREEHPEALAGLENAFTQLDELVDSGRAYRRLRKLDIPDRVHATFYHRDFKNPDRDKSRRTQTYGDWWEGRNNKFQLNLSELKESVEFTVRAGTFVTDPKQIAFFPAPAITTLAAQKHEPAYLYYRLKGDQTPLKGLRQYLNWPAPVEGEETVFAVPFGTTLTLKGDMDRALKTIRVVPPPSDRKGIVPDTDVDFDANNARTFHLELGRMVKAHDFLLEYHDRDGIDGRRRIKIDVTDDAAPRVENLDLALVLRNPKDKSGNKLPIRLPGGKVTSNVYVITRHALVPWKGKITDDIALTQAQWDYTAQQVQIELIGAKDKDQNQPISPAQAIPYARVVSGLQFVSGPGLAYAPRHWLTVTQLVEADLAALAGPQKSWAAAVPLEILQERLAEFAEKEVTIEKVRTLLRTSATPVKFLREHDLHREPGFDFPKFLPMTQPPDPEKEAQYKFLVRVTVSAQDNNVETGPVTGRFAKEPLQFLVVTDNEFLNEIFKEEELLREKLAKVAKKLKDSRVLIAEQVGQLAAKDSDLDLVRIRVDEVRRLVSDTATVTREVKDDYARIVRELEVNVDRDSKRRRGQVEGKLNVTRDKISLPLDRLFGFRGPYPTTEESIQTLFEALDRDVGVKPASVNRDAHIKMTRTCQDNLDWLLEDLSKILNAMEEGIEWGAVLEAAINLERLQRQYAEQFQLWHGDRVRQILEGILQKDKGPQ